MRRPETPNIIDIEASGFGVRSYPIEVGVALEDGGKYCSLILPAPHWEHWDPEAERVHRIGRDVLAAHGRPAEEVAHALNRQFSGRTLFSDAWVVDKPWLNTLFEAARIPMAFSVSPLELILSEAQMERWHEAKAHVLAEVNQQRHRASIDAWVIQQTYVRTFREAGTVPA